MKLVRCNNFSIVNVTLHMNEWYMLHVNMRYITFVYDKSNGIIGAVCDYFGRKKKSFENVYFSQKFWN